MSMSSALAVVGGLGLFVVVLGYPLTLLLLPRRKRSIPAPDPDVWPGVVMITAARNAGALMEAKLDNFRALNYPPEQLTLLIASDASTDTTRQIIEAAADPRIRLIEQKERRGKAAALNLAVDQADAELLLFSDADARLAPDAVRVLARHFSDPQVGGVCGQRRAVRSDARLRDAQQSYINLDSRLRMLESDRGRIGSNDGKIHMIRRALFEPIPQGVSDDFYTLLAVIARKARFLFEPAAVAKINLPARDARHEIGRRRRIVLISWVALFRKPFLLNPLRFGGFAFGLWVNKIGRRLLPFFLLLLAAGAVRGLCAFPLILAALLTVCIGGLLVSRHAQYIAAGLIGTAWGVVDFVIGRRIVQWEPKKNGA